MNSFLGLNQDYSANDLPEGFIPFAKNILLTSTLGAVENEPGFDESSINSKTIANKGWKELLDSGFKPIGALSTTQYEVIWLTNNTNSIIGAYDENKDEFEIKYDDRSNSQPALNLNLNYPIKAVWRENYLGEIYVAWTDNNQSPKILNITNANQVTDLKQTNLFPEFVQPELTAVVESGGTLKTGTYYLFVQYETNNGIQTDYSLPSNPCYIVTDSQTNDTFNFHGNATQVATSKKIKLTINTIDTAYDTINIAVQKFNTGDTTTSFVKILSQSIAGRSSITISYTGQEQETTLTPSDVLVKAPLYSKAKTVTLLNSQLYLGNLQGNNDVSIQQYVNQWSLKWTTELITYNDKDKLAKYSNNRTFAHDEVYAFYATLLYKNGKTSQAFHIPGRAATKTITAISKTFSEKARLTTTDTESLPNVVRVDSTYLTNDDSLNPNKVKYFQVRDTCTWDSVAQEGDFGYWENENETYPDFDEWGNLKGTPVRHHKFPSNAFIRENVHVDTAYGMSKWDLLGVKIKNFSLPAEILANVDKIIISYAKRDFDNSLVVGQDKTSFMGFIMDKVDQISEGEVVGRNTYIYTGYGNWFTLPMSVKFDDKSFSYQNDNYDRIVTPYWFPTPDYAQHGATPPDFYRIKFHSPEVININPSLNGCYIKVNFKGRSVINNNLFLKSDPNDRPLDVQAITNSINGASKNTPESLKVVKLRNFNYVPNNIVAGENNLKFSENGAVADINKVWELGGNDDTTNLCYLESYTYDLEINFPIVKLGFYKSKNPDYDNFYHYNINKYLTDVYNSFSTQDLITAHTISVNNINNTVIKNGDAFFDMYSYNSFTGLPGKDASSNIPNTQQIFIKSIHNFLLESSLNIGLRNSTNNGDKFYSGEPFPAYIGNNDIVTSGNYLTINKDYNKISNDFIAVIFENSNEFTNSFPHRIIQSLPVTSESKYQQWTRFLPLDYYEIQKSKGVINNLQGTVDRLLIHTERALFYTRDKARLAADVAQISLSSGEIFDFAPIEIIPTTNGYTGTQHMFSCGLLPDGYFWVDVQQGKVFLFGNDQVPKELSSQGLFNFFATNLKDFSATNYDNPFTHDGITVTYDTRYKRILMSVKQQTNTDNYKYFTLSYSSFANNGQGGWVSFHDYPADYMFSTRKNVISFKDGKLYKHNSATNKGTYYADKKSSYVDVLFNPYSIPSFVNGKRTFKDSPLILDSVNWNTNFIKSNDVTDFYKTITSLSIRNQYQHSGKIILDYDTNLFKDTNSRNAETKWYCNSFRNIVNDPNIPFIKDILHNFEEINSNLNSNLSWFEKELINNRWFIIRLEYDNVGDYKMVLHSVDINKTDSYR